MNCEKSLLPGVFILFLATNCVGRTGTIMDPTVVTTTALATGLAPLPAASTSATAAPVAGTMANPKSFFATFDPATVYSTLVEKRRVERAQAKLHTDIDAQLDAVIQAQDAAAPGGGPKSHVIADACKAYRKAMAAVADARNDLAQSTQRYQSERDSWLRKNTASAAGFRAAEAAAAGDASKRVVFKTTYLKQAGLVSEWNRMQQDIGTLNDAKSNQNTLWVGLQGASTNGVNVQGLMTAYSTISAQTDTAAASRIQIIAQATLAGLPVPVPVVSSASAVAGAEDF